MSKARDIARSMISRLIRWSVVKEPGVDSGEYPTQGVSYLGRSPALSALWTPFGLHAVPDLDSLALLFSVSGQSDARVHMAGSPKKRPRIKPGEVVLYHPKTGSKIYLKKDGSIAITTQKDLTLDVTGDLTATVAGATTLTSTGDIDLTAPNVNITGNVDITGNLDVSGTFDVVGVAQFGNQILDSNAIDHVGHDHFDVHGTSTGPPK